MAFDFPQISANNVNPNLVNPGASFTQAFQGAAQRGTEQRGQDIQKQVSMAGLGEQGREFDLMQQLRDQQFDLNKQRTMADLGTIGMQQQLMGQQIEQQQYATNMIPKMQANQSFIAKWQTTPDAKNPEEFASNLQDLRSQLPYPEVMGDQTWQGVSSGLEQTHLKTTASINFQNAHNQQLQVLGQAPTLLGAQGTKQFMTNPNGDPTDPTNYNMGDLSQAVLQKQTELQHNTMAFQAQQKISEIQEQGNQRLQYAQALGASRTTNAYERAISQRYATAYNNYTNLLKAGATDAEVSSAKSELDKWSGLIDAYKTNTGDATGVPNNGMPPPVIPTAGSGTSMANPAQSLWNQSIGQ